MPTISRSFFFLAAVLASSLLVNAQEAASVASTAVVPHVVKYSGSLPEAPAAASVVEVKFALYAAQSGGEPLWKETQQVALDPQSRYAVLLGTASPGGLPDALFASGAAKWMGVTLAGGQEAPRTRLSANAYALKAGDAETLGGHPISDFKLATNANPEPDTVDVTSITAGPGITVLNNGTASPTVEINSTYLGNLAAGYGALAGNNIFTGTNKFAATTVGNLTVNGTITSTYLNGIAATLPGLALANTFTKANTFNGPVTLNNALTNKYSIANLYNTTISNSALGGGGATIIGNAVGLYAAGTSTASNAQPVGVYGATGGINGVGLYGNQTSQGGTGAAVYGVLGGYSAVGNSLVAEYGSPAIWADASDQTLGAVHSVALFATSDVDSAAILTNDTANYYAVFIQTTNGYPFATYDTATGAECTINPSADLVCTGSVGGSVTPFGGGTPMAVHAITSPENWIEDAGGGAITSGAGHVDIEPRFLSTVNTGRDYHVFLTPEGDCKGLYVTNKTAGGFDVRELGGGTASIAFSYRIMAKRVGMENGRLEELTKQQEMMKRAHAPRANKIARPAPNPLIGHLSPVAGAK